MTRRIAAILSIIGAVIVLAGAAYVVHKRTPVHQAGQTPGALPPSSSSAVSITPSSSASSSAAPAKIVVAFIGDEYSLGAGASTASKGFVPMVASELGITPYVFATTGGGYAKPGVDGKTYADLVAAAAAVHPAMIVVTGGRNDSTDDSASLSTAVTALFAALHTQAPQAVLAAVTPFWGDSASPTAIVKLAGEIHDGVRGVAGTFIDLTDPLLGNSSDMANANDPNDAGYSAIATNLESRLRPLVITARERVSGATKSPSPSGSSHASSGSHASGSSSASSA